MPQTTFLEWSALEWVSLALQVLVWYFGACAVISTVRFIKPINQAIGIFVIPIVLLPAWFVLEAVGFISIIVGLIFAFKSNSTWAIVDIVAWNVAVLVYVIATWLSKTIQRAFKRVLDSEFVTVFFAFLALGLLLVNLLVLPFFANA